MLMVYISAKNILPAHFILQKNSLYFFKIHPQPPTKWKGNKSFYWISLIFSGKFCPIALLPHKTIVLL